jgi:hypothetical protein
MNAIPEIQPPDVNQNGEVIPELPRIELPEIEDAALFTKEEIEEPAVLVEGLLHVGSKMVLGGGSKAKKTWLLLDLAISVPPEPNGGAEERHRGVFFM